MQFTFKDLARYLYGDFALCAAAVYQIDFRLNVPEVVKQFDRARAKEGK